LAIFFKLKKKQLINYYKVFVLNLYLIGKKQNYFKLNCFLQKYFNFLNSKFGISINNIAFLTNFTPIITFLITIKHTFFTSEFN